MKLPPGKIPIDILKEVVFKNLGAQRSEVILGPAAGVDGAFLMLEAKMLLCRWIQSRARLNASAGKPSTLTQMT